MQSSPDNEFIKITFSVKGNFTSRMAQELTKGKIIDIKLPYGELFQFEHSKENFVFIAGGTGITPFLSVFNDSFFVDYNNPKLYFGVRNQHYNIYDIELELARKINPTLNINIKYQNVDGVLDIDSISYENGISTTYFISGPQIMIASFKSRLISFGLKENFIKTDEWE
jgi:predicted ferric reductase